MSRRYCANKVCGEQLWPESGKKFCAACRHMRARDAAIDILIGIGALLVLKLVEILLSR